MVNEAIRLSLAEDAEDLAAFEERAAEPEVDFEAATRSYSLDEAPLDDEPDDDDYDGGLTEARAEAERGGGVTTEELERRLGLR